MKQYIIEGKHKLKGEVNISGSKNSALPLIAAAILSDEPVTLSNVPNVSDVKNMLTALKEIGTTINIKDNNIVEIDSSTINSTQISYENMKKIRASYYLIGALLAKFKEAKVPMPGGCNLGSRPIDQHIKGFKKLGANIELKQGNIIANVPNKLIGKTIFLDVVSVGATINIMLAASKSIGTTTILNAAKEPHVIDVGNLLIEMGVEINGIGTDEIHIKGKEYLKGTYHKVIPDQIEAATFMILAAGTRSELMLKNVEPMHLLPISSKLAEAGCIIGYNKDTLTIKSPKQLNPINIITSPYPGFPTDTQPQITAALTLASKGISIIKENIFSGRFVYIGELIKMGANVNVFDNVAIIEGVDTLQGAILETPDLRAGAALIIAGLMAEGTTYIREIKYIERGYDNIIDKLINIGAKIKVENIKED